MLSAHLWAFDVVIPCTDKDLDTLELCIAGIREHGVGVERIFILSQRPLTTSAEWIDEAKYPFSKEEVLEELVRGKFTEIPLSIRRRTGWYYQQLLKLYTQQVIPDLSEELLILDADTIFLKETPFFDEQGRVFFTVGRQHHFPYFVHGEKLIPGWHRLFPEHSGIAHHMMFNRKIVQEIFAIVEGRFQEPFWKVFLHLVAPSTMHHSGASEYEIYFNYCLKWHPDHYVWRRLFWEELRTLTEIFRYKKWGAQFVTCHAHFRGKPY